MIRLRWRTRAHARRLEENPGEEYVYGYGENVSMRDWTELILEVGNEEGHWENPEIV